jgi:hypothetical protein
MYAQLQIRFFLVFSRVTIGSQAAAQTVWLCTTITREAFNLVYLNTDSSSPVVGLFEGGFVGVQQWHKFSCVYFGIQRNSYLNME